MSRLVYILGGLFLFLISSTFLSCDDEKFSSNPSHVLSFSRDTIHFDTVFTTIGSSTQILKVYNRNGEGLNIASVRLANASESGFRVNVDGHFGTSFTDLEIRKKDSMYIFVEVTVDPLNRDNPIQVKDSLIFQMTNGVQQDVKLLAYGQDILILKGKTIDKDTVFTSLRPILVYDSLRVNEGSTLTLDKGTRLYFHDKIDCMVHGTLIAEGTLNQPVIFRGDRLDWMFSDVPYDRVAGQWGGVRFYSSSYDNRLNYTDIHGGRYGIRCDSSDVEKLKLSLENSMLHQVQGDGLSIISSKVRVGNSQITNAKYNCVSLLGGDTEFIHCTIANFYANPNETRGDGSAVYVSNIRGNNNYPLLNADFRNCLITGSKEDELSGGRGKDESVAFNYRFSHSLVNTKLNEKSEDYEEELSHYVEVTWDTKEEGKNKPLSKDKNFQSINLDGNYLYDFRPDSLSAALNIGLPADAVFYPLDRQGRNRQADGNPDAGCYEWMSGDN